MADAEGAKGRMIAVLHGQRSTSNAAIILAHADGISRSQAM